MQGEHKARQFPFLFGRAFIEALVDAPSGISGAIFPFLFGRAFIEAFAAARLAFTNTPISLPFRKGFH